MRLVTFYLFRIIRFDIPVVPYPSAKQDLLLLFGLCYPSCNTIYVYVYLLTFSLYFFAIQTRIPRAAHHLACPPAQFIERLGLFLRSSTSGREPGELMCNASRHSTSICTLIFISASTIEPQPQHLLLKANNMFVK